MLQLRSGTVTLLFTDVEGSTQLLRRLGRDYAQLRARCEQLLREAIERHEGFEIDTQGDSLFAAFPAARDALLAAVEAQRALAAEAWTGGVEVRVRMGVHTGEPQIADGRPVGLAVHHAARVMAAAHGGQILVSEATRRLLAEEGVEGLALRDAGAQRLRDFPPGEHVFQVVAEGLRSEFPRPRAARTHRRGIVAAAGAVLALALTAGALLARGGGGGAGVVLRPNSVGLIDPASNRLVGEVPVGQQPASLTVSGGSVWVVNAGDRTISRVDARRRAVIDTIPVADAAWLGGVAVAGGSPWVVAGDGAAFSVSRISPTFDEVVDSVRLGRPTAFSWRPRPLAAEGGRLFALGAAGRLLEVDATARRLVSRYETGVNSVDLAVADGTVWLGSENALLPLDLSTRQLGSRLSVAQGVSGFSVGAGAVWVACAFDDVVARVDVARHAVTTIPVGDQPVDVAVGGGAVWVANRGDSTISRIDPRSQRVTAIIPLGVRPGGIAAGKGVIWVTGEWPQAEKSTR